ncbi:MAG: (2Fe-2S)-binding protein [Parvibaculales bacterium]
MYVCICNAINDQQVSQAISRGCKSPLDIYAECGHEPQCGRCMERMWEMLKASPSETYPAE